MGDSLTAGYGLTRGQAFPARLETLLRRGRPGTVVLGAGLSGETSVGGATRLPRVLAGLDRRPALAIVQYGANDFLRGLPPSSTRAALERMIDLLTDCGVPVLLAGMRAPSWLGERASRFNGVFSDVAAARGTGLYPFFLEGVALVPGLTLADGHHPNAAAVTEVARRILPHVEAMLPEGRDVRAA